MSAHGRWLLASLGMFNLALLLSACQSIPCGDGERGDSCHRKGLICLHPTMMNLARDLDHLERHIDKYGSVVIQKPAVWGQARLTQYRQEFESQMVEEMSNFRETLQGSVSRTDQAYYMNAFALSAAASGEGAVTTYPKGTKDGAADAPQSAALKPGDATIPFGVGTVDKEGNAKASTDFNDPKFFIPGRSADKDRFTGSVKNAAGNLTISLEPTIYLEQKARYLNYLQQIRRTNEGDDTTDAPGYALHLMRIPVSVLPGKNTQAGHGAEVTLTLSSVLGDELLPVTFRNLVINDLVDQISLPLVGFLNDKEDVRTYMKKEWSDAAYDDFMDAPSPMPAAPVGADAAVLLIQEAKASQTSKPATTKRMMIQKAMKGKITRATPSIQGGQGSRLAFPPSQIMDNFGTPYAFRIAYDAHNAFAKDPASAEFIHLPDLQSYLKEELIAAYRFLTTEQNHTLWRLCNRELAEAVRNRQVDQVKKIRDTYRTALRQSAIILGARGKNETEEKLRHLEHSSTAALAWTILVNSALLNEQLNQDRKESASAKGLPAAGDWLPFYLPCPPAEARRAFNEYVKLRWPIHVFALDPITQDQNLSDAFTRRREMQLALSLSFVSGKMNANNLQRFARRIEAEYDTIAINRTAVGFSHGDDTFGWRFYPRFQTPDIESNLTVLMRDMLIGGPNRDQELKKRKIEPGIRECVAIVLMPAFIPYVHCDVSSSWFSLKNPKHRLGDCTDALRLSRSVKSMQLCAGNVKDADCFRDGEIGRLTRKVEQLSARLPLQTQQIQVPYENTIGGFQMFNTGVTDLAPELNGWYGTPGISTRANTTLFLVGRNFSVKNTQVVAGGRPAVDQALLSRQVMRVTIPPQVEVLRGSDGRLHVDLHIATPYGVTQHLLIPVSQEAVPARSGFVVIGNTQNLTAEVVYNKANILQTLTLEPKDAAFTLANLSQRPVDFNLKNATLKFRVHGKQANGLEKDFGETVAINVEFKDRKAVVSHGEINTKLTATLGELAASPALSRIVAQGVLEVTAEDDAKAPTVRIFLDTLMTWRVVDKTPRNGDK